MPETLHNKRLALQDRAEMGPVVPHCSACHHPQEDVSFLASNSWKVLIKTGREIMLRNKREIDVKQHSRVTSYNLLFLCVCVCEKSTAQTFNVVMFFMKRFLIMSVLKKHYVFYVNCLCFSSLHLKIKSSIAVSGLWLADSTCSVCHFKCWRPLWLKECCCVVEGGEPIKTNCVFTQWWESPESVSSNWVSSQFCLQAVFFLNPGWLK